MRKSMKTRKRIASVLCICMMCGAGMTAGAQEKVYEIKMTSTDPGTTVWHTEHLAMADRIRERTDGHVDIQFYGNGEMLVYDEGIEAVMSDASVFYFTDPSLFVDYCPQLKTICAPYLWENYAEVETFNESELYQNILAEAASQNLHAVSPLTVVGTRHILADKPITSVEDCKGLAIRVPGSEIYVDTFDAFGCNYQGLPFSEVYSALETGMISAVEITAGNLVGLRPDESMKGDKYYSLNCHMVNLAGIWCGEGFWNSLPEEYQQIITEEIAVSTKAINKTVDDNAEMDLKAIEDLGITIVEVPDKTSFQDAVAGMNEKMADWDEISAKVREIREAQ
ncbi:MAG: TRAP transporter substrate-binding protein DctP [Lachnospiraceae bacterium]|jgi:TRAP-type C4-dicarboxylate transport system substrate-binding protein|nr:TRAP transporter substrate-binding protein DctP [Lachnospiraceae bacterium]RKJ50687.1 hypothetical protein D7Y05_05880 [bacterium 1XD42-54]